MIIKLMGLAYLGIGIYLWWIGGGITDPFPGSILTFLYSAFLWPVSVGVISLPR